VARSVWKGPFIDGFLLKKAEKTRASGRNEVIKTWSRRSHILPQFVGLTFGVYNGQKFIPVLVTDDMIGHKFGELRRHVLITVTVRTRKQKEANNGKNSEYIARC
jgi:small subunit ribosomal protein S19